MTLCNLSYYIYITDTFFHVIFILYYSVRALVPAILDVWCSIQIEPVLKQLGRVKRFWYLSPMRAAKVQASLRIRAVSPEPPLLAHISSESWGTFRQKARSLAPLNGWACAVKICHDGMLEDTNSLDAAQFMNFLLLQCRQWAVLLRTILIQWPSIYTDMI